MAKSLNKKPPIKKEPIIPLTQQALDDFQSKYDRLKKERVEVQARLKTAREMGDLSENGAYKYAKFELGSIGRQMREIRYVLENAHVQEKTSTGRVGFGNTVTLDRQGKKTTYTLVSGHESDLEKGKLSIDSPIGQAMKDKQVGDQVIVNAPAGEIEYTIVGIE